MLAIVAQAAAGALAWQAVQGLAAGASATDAGASDAAAIVASEQAKAALADLQTRWDSSDLDLKSAASAQYAQAMLKKLNGDGTEKAMPLNFKEALWIAGATGVDPRDASALTAWRDEFHGDVVRLQGEAQAAEAARQARLADAGVKTDSAKQPGQPVAADAHARAKDFSGIDPDTADAASSAVAADGGKMADNTSAHLLTIGVVAGLAGLMVLGLYFGSRAAGGGGDTAAGPAYWRLGGPAGPR